MSPVSTLFLDGQVDDKSNLQRDVGRVEWEAQASKQWHLVEDVVREMESKGVVPNAMTYTALITGCAVCQKADRARDLLSEMIANGVSPNIYTYTALITAYTKSGQWQAALQVGGSTTCTEDRCDCAC